jgi:diguanylate cyclase (GGDEF)-like protein/PAS domain S-box-containing protein
LRISLGQRVIGGFTTAFILIAVIAAVAYWGTTRLVQSTDRVRASAATTLQVEQTFLHLQDVETGVRGYVITGDLAPYYTARGNVASDLEELRRMTANDPAQQTLVEELAGLAMTRIEVVDATLALRRDEGFEAAQGLLLTDQGEQIMDQIGVVVAHIQNYESARYAELSAGADSVAQLTTYVIIGGASLVLLVVLVAIASIRRQVSERQRAVADVELFFSLAVDMLCVADFEGHLERVNPAWAETLGWDTREILEQPYIDLVHPDDREATIAAATKLADGSAAAVSVECRFRCKDGSYRRFQWHAVSRAARRQIYAAGRDVTVERRAESTLRDSEAKHRTVVDNIVDGVIVIDERGIIESFNGSAERIFGYSSDEARGQNVSMLMPEPYHSEHDQYVQTYTNGGPKKIIGIGREVEGRRKDGEIFPLDLAVSEITLDGHRAFVGIPRDISERKRAEEAAFRTGELLKAATMESTADGILVTSLTSGVLYYNSRFLKMWGIPAEVLESKDLEQIAKMVFVQVEDTESFGRAAADLIGTLEESEAVFALKDGRVVEFYSRPLLDAEGVAGRVWSCRDITEREQSAAALRESEERFRSLVQNGSDVITVIDADGKIVYASPSSERLMGYSPAELQGVQLVTLVHPEDISMAVKALVNVAGAPGVHRAAVLRIRHKDGRWRWIETEANNLLDNPAVAGIVHNSRDITERKAVEDALRESEERFRSLTENTLDLICELQPDGRFSYVSPNYVETLGYEPAELLGTSAMDWIHADDRPKVIETIGLALAAAANAPTSIDPDDHQSLADSTGVTTDTEVSSATFRFRHANGSWLWFESTGKLVMSPAQEPKLVIVSREISRRLEAEEAVRRSEERFRSLVQNASDLITVIDPATKLLYQSPSSAHVLGYEPLEMQGAQLVRFVHPDDLTVLLNFIREVLKTSGEALSIELRLLHKDGSWRAVEIVGSDQRADAGIGGIVLNIRDVGERKALEEQLRQQAFSDVLTGLANRARFTDHLEHGLLRARRERTVVAVVFLDLDDFKSVNDSLGHAAGDALLIAVAGRLRESVRPGDTVARFGGDEFAVLLEDASGAGEVLRVAERIVEALRVPFEVEGRQRFARASLGVSLSTSGQIDGDDLMRNADVAMYVAKGRGKGRYELYAESMHDALMERVDLLSDLQEAIAGASEFVVHYQPVLRLETGEIVGMEALVRWQHPERGLLPPDQFISLAEESGAILPLGRWVLEQACHQVRTWQSQHASTPRLTVAVNVSVRQLQHAGFLQEVREALEGSGLDPGDLVLEITESVMMQDVETTIARLRELKSLGVRLAIDDFGTGYSSLSYLQQFPLDILKIDKAFVSTVNQGDDGSDLTRAIVQIAKTLGLETVAEGIEQLDQLAVLRSLGCDLGQGYYFARPLSPVQMDAYLASAARGRRAA